MDDTWDRLIDQFWVNFDEERPDDMRDAMRDLVALRPEDDAAALYELASVNDSTGKTVEAIGLYRRALEEGLNAERHPQAVLQLASSLRAHGDCAACLEVLDQWQAAGSVGSTVIGSADAVVRALALHDLGRHEEALQAALFAVIPTLPRYQRSMSAYAAMLTAED